MSTLPADTTANHGDKTGCSGTDQAPERGASGESEPLPKEMVEAKNDDVTNSGAGRIEGRRVSNQNVTSENEAPQNVDVETHNTSTCAGGSSPKTLHGNATTEDSSLNNRSHTRDSVITRAYQGEVNSLNTDASGGYSTSHRQPREDDVESAPKKRDVCEEKKADGDENGEQNKCATPDNKQGTGVCSKGTPVVVNVQSPSPQIPSKEGSPTPVTEQRTSVSGEVSSEKDAENSQEEANKTRPGSTKTIPTPSEPQQEPQKDVNMGSEKRVGMSDVSIYRDLLTRMQVENTDLTDELGERDSKIGRMKTVQYKQALDIENKQHEWEALQQEYERVLNVLQDKIDVNVKLEEGCKERDRLRAQLDTILQENKDLENQLKWLQKKREQMEEEQRQIKQREEDVDAKMNEVNESQDEKSELIRELHARITKANNQVKLMEKEKEKLEQRVKRHSTPFAQSEDDTMNQGDDERQDREEVRMYKASKTCTIL